MKKIGNKKNSRLGKTFQHRDGQWKASNDWNRSLVPTHPNRIKLHWQSETADRTQLEHPCDHLGHIHFSPSWWPHMFTVVTKWSNKEIEPCYVSAQWMEDISPRAHIYRSLHFFFAFRVESERLKKRKQKIQDKMVVVVYSGKTISRLILLSLYVAVSMWLDKLANTCQGSWRSKESDDHSQPAVEKQNKSAHRLNQYKRCDGCFFPFQRWRQKMTPR